MDETGRFEIQTRPTGSLENRRDQDGQLYLETRIKVSRPLFARRIKFKRPSPSGLAPNGTSLTKGGGRGRIGRVLDWTGDTVGMPRRKMTQGEYCPV